MASQKKGRLLPDPLHIALHSGSNKFLQAGKEATPRCFQK